MSSTSSQPSRALVEIKECCELDSERLIIILIIEEELYPVYTMRGVRGSGRTVLTATFFAQNGELYSWHIPYTSQHGLDSAMRYIILSVAERVLTVKRGVKELQEDPTCLI
jgi:hypothetical protein